jgi:hypothetical protein
VWIWINLVKFISNKSNKQLCCFSWVIFIHL